LIRPGDIVVGARPGREVSATAIVLEGGVLELESGDRFTAPSKAAMSLGYPGSINGWDFWVHQETGKTLGQLRARLHTDTDPDETPSLFDRE